jgi:hypothetical protein
MAEETVVIITSSLIEEANKISSSCTGTNCNVSKEINSKIYQDLSILSQKEASIACDRLRIPKELTICRDVFDGFLKLSFAVSSVYSYQCGSTGVASNCINSSSTVNSAQKNLVDILNPIFEIENSHITSIIVLLFIGIISFSFFLLFAMIGLIELPFKSRGATSVD